MSRFRPRFTVRRLMVAVAISGVVSAFVAAVRSIRRDGNWSPFLELYGGSILIFAVVSLALAGAFLFQLARQIRRIGSPDPPEPE
jgi:nitrate reductase NapE component